MKNIKSIEITNSEFYSPDFKLVFNEKLNCLMGGRGTGKSTILHFIKACLDENAENDKTTYGVLKNNLGNGLIKLFIQAENDELYRIEKSFGEEPQPYLNSTNRHISIENIKKELICDIFPAQYIEEIGRNSEARLELIDRMLIGEVEDIFLLMESTTIDLEKNSKEIRSVNQRIQRTNEQLLEYKTADDDLKNCKSEQPEGIKEEERIEFDKQDAAEKTRNSEKRFLKNLYDKLTEHLDQIKSTNEDIISSRTLSLNINKFINKGILNPISKEIEQTLQLITNSNQLSEKQIENLQTKILSKQEELKKIHDQQHNVFVQLKQKLEKNKVFFDKLNLLSKKVEDRNIRLKELDELIEKRKKLKVIRDKEIRNLNNLKENILNKRSEKIQELNKQFEGRVKITLTPGGITNEYEDALRNGLKGSNMRYNAIIPNIIGNFSPDAFAMVIHNQNTEKLREITGIDIERSKAIIDALYETDAIYEIEAIYNPDLPEFHLKVDKEEEKESKGKDNYKKSDELSTGQRCTTVLPIVFAISKNPLIIDQPEDNLDNKYISETIHKIIKQQKQERQLIFITHNANIPVLSESEDNIFLKYNDKKATIIDQGSVDAVKTSILNLLEGGEFAFKERMRLYNY